VWVLPYSGRGSTESAGLWKKPITQKKAKKSEMYDGLAEIQTQELRRVKAGEETTQAPCFTSQIRQI
jgi:hypothetical protein